METASPLPLETLERLWEHYAMCSMYTEATIRAIEELIEYRNQEQEDGDARPTD